MLTKLGIETVVPPVEGVEGSPESTYCTPPPPDEEDGGGPTPPPDTAEGDDGDSDGAVQNGCTLWVPNNIYDKSKGEVPTPWTLPAPPGYVCSTVTKLIYTSSGEITGYEVAYIHTDCYWSLYP